jgi:uncharacterized membrane protein
VTVAWPDEARDTADSSRGRALILRAAIVGIGFSGFFDGILLHQVLQWHHLLGLVPGEGFDDIGNQILADGLFHLLMYLVTALGLWLLWRRGGEIGADSIGWRSVAGGGLLGFGIWNVVDVGFFHWVLGIHRIRVNVPDPLLYDLAWLAAFGLMPAAVAGLLLTGGQRAATRGTGTIASFVLAVLAVGAGAFAARPQPNLDTALVLFAPGTSLAQAINTAVEAGAPVVWMDTRGRMLAVSLKRPDAVRQLYRAGALFVTRSPAIAGCGAALKA